MMAELNSTDYVEKMFGSWTLEDAETNERACIDALRIRATEFRSKVPSDPEYERVRLRFYTAVEAVNQARRLLDEMKAGVVSSAPQGQLSPLPCKKCGAIKVYVSDYGDRDHHIKCYGCNQAYIVDGIDY